MSTRTLNHVIPGVETSDGAGVRLRRSIGSSAGTRLDPFLMLDEFGTENPEDYIAGFLAQLSIPPIAPSGSFCPFLSFRSLLVSLLYTIKHTSHL